MLPGSGRLVPLAADGRAARRPAPTDATAGRRDASPPAADQCDAGGGRGVTWVTREATEVTGGLTESDDVGTPVSGWFLV